ncbi:MAG: DNA polymerase ligase N-terminal domain-containing protein [Patescibacteria group bacterium]|nr:DNA polymerase ligase N-terminal domain-containing protein [Patescibacteria group bacterium]
MALEEYKKKRKFERTPEPKAEKGREDGSSFVVQKHNAQNLHYDFRLERSGVLVSWAVPKGPPEKVGDKKLAIRVEDHPVSYKDFEGQIPEGEYGAGQVEIWDKGEYETLKWDEKDDGVIEFVLKGNKLQGRYSLVKTKGYGGNKESWLLIKNKPKD